MKAVEVTKQRSVKKLSMQPTARGVSAFQENSIKDSKTLLIMKAGSVKNHQCRSQPEVVTKPRRAQTNQIVCFLNQQIINCNTGGQKTTQCAKKGVTKKSNLYKTLACERRTKQLEKLVVTKPRSVKKKLSMQPTTREFSAFQAKSIKDSKTLLIMKPGSVK